MKTYTIYVEIKGGALQNIYGDQLPTACQIEFILRDFDNIESGDPDPQPEGYKPEVYYW
jgi:hypothetical protein